MRPISFGPSKIIFGGPDGRTWAFGGRCTAAARVQTSNLAAAGIVDRRCRPYALLDARQGKDERPAAQPSATPSHSRSRPRSECLPSECLPSECLPSTFGGCFILARRRRWGPGRSPGARAAEAHRPNFESARLSDGLREERGVWEVRWTRGEGRAA